MVNGFQLGPIVFLCLLIHAYLLKETGTGWEMFLVTNLILSEYNQTESWAHTIIRLNLGRIL